MEVNQATFARMASVSRASISGKIKNKTLIINSAGMLDTDNPVNREYLNMHQVKQAQIQSNFAAATATLSGGEKIPANIPKIQTKTSGQAPRGYAMTDSAATRAAGIPEYMLGLTIRELVAQHGTLQNIEKYVKILRDLTTADEKDQRLQERRNILISKAFVTSHLFGLQEQQRNKMLDMPERVVDGLIALVQSGAENCRQQMINNMRDNISVIFADTTELMIKQLKGLENTASENETDTLQDLKEQIDVLTEKTEAANA